MNVTLKVIDAQSTMATHTKKAGEALITRAQNSVNYQLIDNETGFAPQNIIVKRVDHNLHVLLEDGDMEPDIIIEDYYGDGNPAEVTNLLVGQHENSNIYAYVPESGDIPDAVSMLSEEIASPQVLGGREISAFWTFDPSWLLALVPIVAFVGGIAVSEHNNDKSARDTVPQDGMVAGVTPGGKKVGAAAPAVKEAADDADEIGGMDNGGMEDNTHLAGAATDGAFRSSTATAPVEHDEPEASALAAPSAVVKKGVAEQSTDSGDGEQSDYLDGEATADNASDSQGQDKSQQMPSKESSESEEKSGSEVDQDINALSLSDENGNEMDSLLLNELLPDISDETYLLVNQDLTKIDLSIAGAGGLGDVDYGSSLSTLDNLSDLDALLASDQIIP
ncbi:MAG: hypothetical protein CSA45_05725 [Gammaproteobacteria bacterium]|nr:MAG: hypothetical protein CSA45_05725 [Gammaproteobacteria bacterium]